MEIKRKLVFVFVCYMAGGGLYRVLGTELWVLVFPAVVAIVLLFAFWPGGRMYYITALVFFCLGITSYVLYYNAAEAVQEFEGEWVTAEGRVEPVIEEDCFLLSVDSMILNGRDTGYRGKLMVYPGGDVGAVTVGWRAVAEGQLRLPTDGGYRNYCRGLGAESLLYSTPYHIEFGPAKPNSLKYHSGRAAGWVKRQLEAGIIPQENSEIMKGLLLGGKEVSDETRARFSAVGISHLLAVSGLHTGIICGVLVWALRKLGLMARERFFIICSFLALFSFMVGLTPSVLRASVMMGVVMLAGAVDRKQDAPTSFCFTAFLLLVFQPYILYSISFQLSFLACLGIILFFPVFNRILVFAGKYLSSAISITLSSQVLILPLLVFYFDSFAPVSVLANILVVPLAAVVLWLTVAFLVLYPLHIPLYYNIVWVNDIIIEIIDYIIIKAGAIPFGSIMVENAGKGFYMAYYTAAAAFLLLWHCCGSERRVAV